MKKILITGVFGSGKTSLINLIKNKLEFLNKKVLVYTEVARECPFDLNYNQNLISTSWLVMRQIEKEMTTLDEDYDFVIYDRGIPDIVAHTNTILKEGEEDDLIYKKLEDLGKVSLNNFNYIFLSKRSGDFNIQVDDIRIDDANYQIKLEGIHIEYLNKIKSKYIPLEDKNNDRLRQVLSVIL